MLRMRQPMGHTGFQPQFGLSGKLQTSCSHMPAAASTSSLSVGSSALAHVRKKRRRRSCVKHRTPPSPKTVLAPVYDTATTDRSRGVASTIPVMVPARGAPPLAAGLATTSAPRSGTPGHTCLRGQCKASSGKVMQTSMPEDTTKGAAGTDQPRVATRWWFRPPCPRSAGGRHWTSECRVAIQRRCGPHGCRESLGIGR